jgi:cytochrome c-type biogenesis protein CcmE
MQNSDVGIPSQDEQPGSSLLPPNRDASSTVAGNDRRTWVWGVVAVIVVAIGFFVLKAVGDAATYFRTTDEAVAERQDLATRRFRLEGCVVTGSVATSGNTTTFAVSGQQSRISVVHTGTPPALFKDNMPVVLEGSFAATNDTYQSDRIMVRHSEEYTQANPDNVDPGQCKSVTSTQAP